VRDDATLAAQRALAKRLRLVWDQRTHKGFFLRAEDFFGFGRRVAKMRVDLDERLAEVDQEFKDPYSRGLAAGPTHASLGALTERYGSDLDARSHGEGFLKLFEARLVPRGLYLMDEPEAALSPQNQLVLLALLKEMIAQESQFIIATHSPMILAYPEACIYDFDTDPIRVAQWEELEHVTLTRAFLADPQRFLGRM